MHAACRSAQPCVLLHCRRRRLLALPPPLPPTLSPPSPPINSTRRPKELRQLKASLGVLAGADGSALFEMGNTKVLAAVWGPKPCEQRSAEDEARCVIKCEYSMAAFSTGEGGG